MADLARTHQALAEDYRWHLQIAPASCWPCRAGSLDATVAILHAQTEGITLNSVRSLPAFLDHSSPEFDAFMRLKEQVVSFEEAYQRCLAEQGQGFLDAIEATKASGRWSPTTTWPNSRTCPRKALPETPVS